MKLTYHVHVRATDAKTETERTQARLKRKHGWRAILRAFAHAQTAPPAPQSAPAPDGTLTPTLPQTEPTR